MTPTRLARKAHPHNRNHRRKYVRALAWLRARNGWVLDRFGKKPAWGNVQ